MIRYSSETTIARPPAVVLDALLDPARYAQWTDMVDMEFDSPGRPVVGTSGRFRLSKGDIKGMIEMKVRELVPDSRLVVQMTHPQFDWTSISTLDQVPGGTKLTYAGEMSLHGWRRILEPMVGREITAGEGKEVERLKELLEAAPIASAEPAAPAGAATA